MENIPGELFLIFVSPICSFYLTSGDREILQSQRRLHDNQQREKPAGHQAQGQDGVLLPRRDAQVPLPPVRRQTRVPPGPVGVQHRGAPPAHVPRLESRIEQMCTKNSYRRKFAVVLDFFVLLKKIYMCLISVI